MLVFSNVDAVNEMLPEFGVDQLSTGGMWTLGGAGYAYIMLVDNIRVGGMGYSGSMNSSDVVDGFRKEADYVADDMREAAMWILTHSDDEEKMEEETICSICERKVSGAELERGFHSDKDGKFLCVSCLEEFQKRRRPNAQDNTQILAFFGGILICGPANTWHSG